MGVVYKDDVEQARRRVEAWWHGEILDRVVVHATAPRSPGRRRGADVAEGLGWGQERLRRHFTDPELVMPRLEAQVRDTHYGGEAFPVVFPVSIGMVAITANYLGCPLRFMSTQTTWHEPIIEDPLRLPPLEYSPGNEWWKASRVLLEAAVARADGYHVGIPDLNGPTEILGLLRGNEKLAFDFHDHPGYIRPALARINQAWYRYWQEATAITQRTGGWLYWMGFWSDRPSIDLQSDFCCLLSREHFNEHFLPSIEEQTRMVERTIYHLDGPGAIRHVDALLSLERLSGIQWIQGAGGGSVLRYVALLKKIQDAGKLVSAYCEKHELEPLLDALKPEGFFPIVTGCESPAEADEVVRLAARKSGRRR